jgi:hypothetical protein
MLMRSTAVLARNRRIMGSVRLTALVELEEEEFVVVPEVVEGDEPDETEGDEPDEGVEDEDEEEDDDGEGDAEVPEESVDLNLRTWNDVAVANKYPTIKIIIMLCFIFLIQLFRLYCSFFS